MVGKVILWVIQGLATRLLDHVTLIFFLILAIADFIIFPAH